MKVTALISVCKYFQGNGRLNTGADLRLSSVRQSPSQKYIQKKKLEGQVPWSPNDMHQEEEDTRNCGNSMDLCLMGYTDQSGIRLWQHLSRRVHCCMSCVVPIRIIDIDNTHLCDLEVHLLKEKKGLCKTGARLYPTFSHIEYTFWKESVRLQISVVYVAFLLRLTPKSASLISDDAVS